jgi:hypothetical protein
VNIYMCVGDLPYLRITEGKERKSSLTLSCGAENSESFLLCGREYPDPLMQSSGKIPE